ncbi:alcohol dehydrogenase catalytic domain-containing protein [Amycolatopsis mongoliensis]|uniref:Alcohol dehydrogenase catalytic domain-containing protein n=1 Tax=Amycolatopsis mongoliensis TaxID=715475 RepID=A0A9Y2NB71_9PSEU|nr:alcohol dehydrogenase catalytic domain-containing protein [Amycolatopsis sp. 4-36]WIX98171.1 alcohol dehydrogenase catalytic domain-containing protein [Amycolatopsis sp. 4-36]
MRDENGWLPATMQAVRFDSVAGTLTLDEVPTPTPDIDEVVVKIVACGICKSDVNRIDGVVRPRMPVYTPGHEAAGVVAAVGERVVRWAPGDRVVMAAGRPCGECATCRGGAGSDGCTDLRMMAIHYDGAWAEYAVTSATSLVAVPDSLPMEQATVLSGAVSTPYGAIDTARLRPAEAVGVWGLGGLGTHLVQLARVCGASPIIALDTRPAARELALMRGADIALDPANTRLESYIKAITKGRGLDVAFDFVGRARSFSQARTVLGDRGRLVVVGTSLDVDEAGPEFALTRNNQTVVAHTGYRVKHLEDLVELVERGRLDVSASISAVLPLSRVAEGLQRMREYDGNLLRLLLRP